MGTLNGELKQQVLNNRRAQAMSITKRGQRVILVGCMATNLPPGLRDHPLIECWYGDNGLGKFHVPDTAGLIMHTRFVQHKDLVRLKEEAYRKRIEFYPQPLTTGDLREILEPLAIVPPKAREPMRLMDQGALVARAPVPVKEEPMSQMKPAYTPRGALKQFVLAHADFGATSDVAEVNRLLPIVGSPEHVGRLGAVTRGSLLATYRRQRKEKGLPPRLRGNFKGRPRHGVITRPPVAVTVSPVVQALLAPATDDVLRLFDEAMSQMQNAMAATELARERYVQLLAAKASAGDVKKLLAELAARL